MQPQSHVSRRSRRIAGENAPETALPVAAPAAPCRQRVTLQPAQDAIAHLPPAVTAELGRQFLEEHAVSHRTGSNYKLNVARVQAWLDKADQAAEYRDGLKKLDENSEQACYLWMCAHVEHLSFGYLTYHHSALAKHFQNNFGCSKLKAAGWHQKADGTWRGNPVYSERYLAVYAGAKRKGGRAEDPVRHALPMLYPMLAKLLTTLDTQREEFNQNPNELTAERTHAEFSYCFMVMAYRLWLRCDEACNLKWGEIDTEPTTDPLTGSRFISVRITWRKTNQMDASATKPYQLHYLPGRPKVDAITAVKAWLDYTTWVRGRAPAPGDLVFPGWRPKTGQLELNRVFKSSDINTILKRVFDDAAVRISIGAYKYTSHGFRRGGAQDAAVYAEDYGEKLKSIGHIKWWGGWDAGESPDTLVKYIMNVVSAREDYYGDCENPRKNGNQRTAFWSGGGCSQDDQTLVAFQQGAQSLQQHVDQAVSSMEQRLITHISQAISSRPAVRSDQPEPLTSTGGPAAAPVPAPTSSAAAGTPNGAQAPSLEVQATITHGGRVLAMKIPAVTTVEQVVIQWERGDPRNGLTALKDWKPAMRRKGKGGNASLFLNRKKIYQAWVKRARSMRAFYQAYGGPKRKLSDYLAAIDAENRADSTARGRSRSATSA